MATYILWNISSDLFSFGPFTLRWNAFLILAAYLTGRHVLVYIFKKEGKPSKDVATLTAYFLIAALLGARLAYVAFYQPELLWTKPGEIFFPFSFQPSFHLTASTGFSIHGATLGILIVALFYSRKTGPGKKKYFQVLDRISIISALTGFFLFLGSFLNSEIIGKPTHSAAGTIFIQPIIQGLQKIPCCIMRNPNGENPLELVVAKKGKKISETNTTHQAIILYLFFKPGVSEQLVNEFLIGDVKTFLFDMSRIVYEPGTEPLHFTIIVAKDGKYIGRVITKGITRYPVQAIEALSCLVLFIFLFMYWNKHKVNTPPASLFGYFMIFFWSVHLVCVYLRENQAQTQIGFDVLFILTGIIALVFSIRNAGRMFSRHEKK